MLDIRALIDKILQTLSELQTDTNNKVNKAGDTMTDDLIMDNASIIANNGSTNTITISGDSIVGSSSSFIFSQQDPSTNTNTPYFSLGNNTCENRFTIAKGSGTKASGMYSIAQNLGTTAVGQASTVIGTYNALDTIPTDAVHEDGTAYGNYAFIIGNGTSTSRNNAFRITWKGNIDMGSTAVDRCWFRTRTVNNTQIPIYVYDEGDTYGQNIVIGGGGSTVIGAGESASNLYSVNPNGMQTGSENLHLAADNAIYFYSNCNTIANRKQGFINTSGRPVFAAHNTGTVAPTSGLLGEVKYQYLSVSSSATTYADLIKNDNTKLGPGSWFIHWSIYCDVNTANKVLSGRLYNSTGAAAWNWSRAITHTSTTGGTSCAGAMTITLTAETQLSLQGYQNSGSAKTMNAYFRAQRIW